MYANAAAVKAAAAAAGARSGSQQLPKEATLTERERIGEQENGENADYESIIVSPEGRMVPVSLVSKKNSRDNNRDTMNNSRDSNSCSRENSQPLQSVALVSEVMQNQQQHQQLSKDDGGSPVLKPVLRKQYSNSSIHSSGSAGATAKGPPPPYKQPPPPPAAPAGFGGPNVSPNSSGSNRLNTNCDPSSAGGSSTYANVQIRHHHPSKFFLPLSCLF